VTVADLYHEVVAMRADLAALLTKIERADERGAAAEGRVADHEVRLRQLESAVPSSLEVRIMSLEKFRWQIAGGIIAIQILGVLVQWFVFSKK
jgi:hypothetical protein